MQLATTEKKIRHLTTLALAVVFVFVFVLGGLAATVRINSAVIAQGALVVDSYVKPVQHQKGGIVARISVRNGDRVSAGQVLVHLDDTQTKINLAIVSRRLEELAARSARLMAERDGGQTISFRSSPGRLDVNETRSIENGEQRLFDDRRASMQGKIAQLRERIHQLDQQATGLMAEQDGKRRAIAVIGKELTSLEPLLSQGVIPATRVYALQRDQADLNGELGSLLASVAEVKGKIAETELQIIQLGDDQRSDVSEQLKQAESESGQYLERRAAIEDDLRHADITAPQDGIVHQLAVHAPGTVIPAGDAIMQIVPDHDALVPELKLSPRDVDQVAVGKAVELRFPAFNYRTTLEITGNVASLSAELTTDKASGQSYYTVRVAVSATEWQRLGALTPIAGMPVEAFIATGEQTGLSYVAKPFTDQLARAFRED
ncbi:HlyD family type I secretion periplasmic adaptor subunit (plasmid) [Rhizobium grahamii]|uniref:Membrane fusion protein (MFP) family protein n=1 Tax=Rhizobium grahamii TaxID=1120045 RepID=A0A5Q0CHJ1_9HYPH|nr:MULTISPECIES: HlyD family type I secretion periplasmic adaptor subunit [Rhizobium]QFY63771.1 HlyD family type I secretion periplasmic adaptor subunit [Rhizobium grahamii]QRM51468.1 HlyD family type I secretion periplasmic adaptor subunit [Rhizobium sp. BG6]QRM52985.1 HlyD family type I secretion periplasmic adaptor subunit [Rhizobium sp. BG6]